MRTTGDAGVLDERVPFLTAPPLLAEEHESYGLPAVAGRDGTLFEHCLRAIDRGITAGAHGLPLFGAGDWNDGMNRVGAAGRGESTWLGFFLHGVLTDFAALCDARDDQARADRYRDEARRLAAQLELTWDGEWYRRGYYDDGTPLGVGAERRMPRSIRSRSRGRCCRAPCRCVSPNARWTRSASMLVARRSQPDPAAAIRPSIARRRNPGTSRGIRRACARTAGSTPMPRPGS